MLGGKSTIRWQKSTIRSVYRVEKGWGLRSLPLSYFFFFNGIAALILSETSHPHPMSLEDIMGAANTDNQLLDLSTVSGWELLFTILNKAIEMGEFSCPDGNLLIPLGAGIAVRVDKWNVSFVNGREVLCSSKHYDGLHECHHEKLMDIKSKANLKVMMEILGRCSLK